MNSQDIEQKVSQIDFRAINEPLSKIDRNKLTYSARYNTLNKLPQPILKFMAQHYFKLVWVSLTWTLLTIMNTNVLIKYIMITGNLITIILLLVIRHANIQTNESTIRANNFKQLNHDVDMNVDYNNKPIAVDSPSISNNTKQIQKIIAPTFYKPILNTLVTIDEHLEIGEFMTYGVTIDDESHTYYSSFQLNTNVPEFHIKKLQVRKFDSNYMNLRVPNLTALPVRYPAHVKSNASNNDIQKTTDYLNNRQNADFIMNLFGSNSSLIDIYIENNCIILQWSNNEDYQQMAQATIQLANHLQ